MDGCETREPKSGVRARLRPDPSSADAAASVRPARAGELVEIAAVFAPALEPYRGSKDDWILDTYLRELEDVHPRFEDGEVLVAERDGRIVGTVTFYADVRLEGWSNLLAGWAGFRALAVHPEMRGAGIGNALVRRCIDRSREVGARTLGLHTISLLTDAVRLYERLGFVRCPEFDLQAANIFPSANAEDMTALAFRLEVERAPRRR